MRTTIATFLGLTLCSASAFATPGYLIAAGPALYTFDINAPTAFTGLQVITGLGAGETLVGADFRPATGQLFALTRDAAGAGKLYTINVNTAAATLVAPLAADPTDSTNPYTSLV